MSRAFPVNANDDFLKVRDVFMECLSNRSIDSQQTTTSKMSFLSSHSSNPGDGPQKLTADGMGQNKQRQIKLENARINLEIQSLRTEKAYYQQICDAIQRLLETQGSDGPDDLVQCLTDILTVDPEP